MWIEFSKQRPKKDRDLWYFFEWVGVHKGQYWGNWVFTGDRGFLGGDVTHWQYDTGQEEPSWPKGFKRHPAARFPADGKT